MKNSKKEAVAAYEREVMEVLGELFLTDDPKTKMEFLKKIINSDTRGVMTMDQLIQKKNLKKSNVLPLGKKELPQ